ncbi:golvesin C-terminal-like domain-containing protein [Catelliglobosispora koreensis]|uniref:golvesin C-terminal-like domain-containing protein n=1 Tax=Catelliglobosispora koreensis TaxID=129052 RepID=UPI0003644846|nr:family 16 glycosylhydrolase [Catelliglobosispora koreensis]
MRRFVLAAVAATLVLAPAAPAQADPIGGTGWSLVFNDDFDGTSVDTTKWNYRTDVKALSAQEADNVSVGNGVMSISQEHVPDHPSGKDFTGGGLITKQKFRYGYYETRARINDGPGWHTAFWLQCGDGATTFPACQRTEIDGFEIDSHLPTSLRHNIITWKGSGVSNSFYSSTGVYNIGFDLRQWHTYGIDWSETSVKYYVDGVLKATQNYAPSAWMHDYTNIWLTSIGYAVQPDPAKLPSTAQFDYIKYWQKDYYLDNDGPAAYGYSETGSWSDSTVTGWTHSSPTRFATCGVAGATATWRPNLRTAGTYQVYVYKAAHAHSDANTRYDVAGTTTFVNGTSGASGWVSLGTFSLPAGTGTAVQLTSSGNGCARADAVKFVRS